MNRRRFLQRTAAAGIGAMALPYADPEWLYAEDSGKRFTAFDMRPIPGSGLKVSRLAMGSGAKGSSHTKRVGFENMVGLIRHGTERGLNFWDMADMYKSHHVFKEALKHVDRGKVAILTKSVNRTAEGMKADIERFRKELNTDYIDILLMHYVHNPNWGTEWAATRDVISEAREKGLIRTYGLSIHDLQTFKNAVEDPWPEVILERINPAGAHMDGSPEEVAPLFKRGDANGKFMVGMKIVGEGDLRNRVDESLKYVHSLGSVHNYTIGFESVAELDGMVDKISRVRV
ncbi:aldo/keto reductase [candidate division KSB1 bacterium]